MDLVAHVDGENGGHDLAFGHRHRRVDREDVIGGAARAPPGGLGGSRLRVELPRRRPGVIERQGGEVPTPGPRSWLPTRLRLQDRPVGRPGRGGRVPPDRLGQAPSTSSADTTPITHWRTSATTATGSSDPDPPADRLTRVTAPSRGTRASSRPSGGRRAAKSELASLERLGGKPPPSTRPRIPRRSEAGLGFCRLDVPNSVDPPGWARGDLNPHILSDTGT